MEHLELLIDSKEAPPIWIDKDNLKKLPEIRSILVVGPSSAGKTTLVNMMRKRITDSNLSIFEVPQRILTRPVRENDDMNENRFTTPEEFAQLTKGGVAWDRDMGDGRVERYGFPPAELGKVPIYSANSAILEEGARIISSDPEFLNHTLIVFVNASVEVLEARLGVRSADLFRDKPKEAEMRLHEVEVSPRTHIVVDHSDNSFDTLEKSAQIIIAAVQTISET